MYPKLNDYNFITILPDKFTLSFYLNNRRSVMGINESAKSILELCNGENSVEDIINCLSLKYNEDSSKVEEFVSELLYSMYENKLITYQDKSSNRKNMIIKGSKEYFTPEFIVLELTQACLLRCKHCYLNAGKGNSIANDELKNLCKVIDDLGVNGVQLTGGEPLIHKNIIQAINYFVDKKIKVQITTSGMIHDDEIFNTLKRLSEVDGIVQVSLDGFKDSHNNIRQNDESYDRAITFIKRLISLNINVVVATCIIDQSDDEIENLTIMLKEIGVKMHRIGTFSMQGRAKKNNLVQIKQNNDIEMFLSYLKDKYNTSEYKISGFEDHSELKDCINCGAGYKILKISPNLKVYPCPMMQVEIGDLNIESIQSILKRNSSNFSHLAKPTKLTCKDCEKFEKCENCISEAFLNKKEVISCMWYENQKYIIGNLGE